MMNALFPDISSVYCGSIKGVKAKVTLLLICNVVKLFGILLVSDLVLLTHR